MRAPLALRAAGLGAPRVRSSAGPARGDDGRRATRARAGARRGDPRRAYPRSGRDRRRRLRRGPTLMPVYGVAPTPFVEGAGHVPAPARRLCRRSAYAAKRRSRPPSCSLEAATAVPARWGCCGRLCERGIVPDLVVGSSIGAINAAFFAGQPTLEGTYLCAEMWRSRRNRTMSSRRAACTGPGASSSGARRSTRSRGCGGWCSGFLRFDRLEDSLVPLTVVATRLQDGVEEWLTEGPALEAILASAALPAIFPAVEREGNRYIDGGVVDNTPLVGCARRGRAADLRAAVRRGELQRRRVRAALRGDAGRFRACRSARGCAGTSPPSPTTSTSSCSSSPESRSSPGRTSRAPRSCSSAATSTRESCSTGSRTSLPSEAGCGRHEMVVPDQDGGRRHEKKPRARALTSEAAAGGTADGSAVGSSLVGRCRPSGFAPPPACGRGARGSSAARPRSRGCRRGHGVR